MTLLEARKELGGRVLRESALPGLNEWRRVMDWRMTQIKKMKNVAVYPSSPMTAEEILETGARNIILATGATWRRDGMGRTLRKPIHGYDLQNVYNPDDLMDGEAVIGKLEIGNWVIYDDDHYYMGGVLAELLATNGHTVSLVTPAPFVSYWSQFTLEQERIQHKLTKLGVRLYAKTVLSRIESDCVRLTDIISGNEIELQRDGVVLVSDRISNDSMYYELHASTTPPADGGSATLRARCQRGGTIKTLRVIGDAEAPNIIAQAVFSGHLAAREFDEEKVEGTPFKVERMTI